MPIGAPAPKPEQLPPWTWTVRELGEVLTPAQRATLLARFRAIGFKTATWPT